MGLDFSDPLTFQDVPDEEELIAATGDKLVVTLENSQVEDVPVVRTVEEGHLLDIIGVPEADGTVCVARHEVIAIRVVFDAENFRFGFSLSNVIHYNNYFSH